MADALALAERIDEDIATEPEAISPVVALAE